MVNFQCTTSISIKAESDVFSQFVADPLRTQEAREQDIPASTQPHNMSPSPLLSSCTILCSIYKPKGVVLLDPNLWDRRGSEGELRDIGQMAIRSSTHQAKTMDRSGELLSGGPSPLLYEKQPEPAGKVWILRHSTGNVHLTPNSGYWDSVFSQTRNWKIYVLCPYPHFTACHWCAHIPHEGRARRVGDYRMTNQVVLQVLLISKQKLHFY